MPDYARWLPAWMRRPLGIVYMVQGLLVGGLMSTVGVASFDHFLYQSRISNALMTGVNNTTPACMIWCHSDGRTSLYFGTFVGHVDVDLHQVNDGLSAVTNIMAALFATTDSALITARTVVIAVGLLSAALGVVYGWSRK